jgi:hypothetical protein
VLVDPGEIYECREVELYIYIYVLRWHGCTLLPELDNLLSKVFFWGFTLGSLVAHIFLHQKETLGTTTGVIIINSLGQDCNQSMLIDQ